MSEKLNRISWAKFHKMLENENITIDFKLKSIKEDNIEIFQYLYGKINMVIDVKEGMVISNSNPFLIAAQHNAIKICKFIIDEGHDCHIAVIRKAVIRNHIDLVKYFIETNKFDTYGILQFCKNDSYLDMAKMLINMGIDVNSRSGNDDIPLHYIVDQREVIHQYKKKPIPKRYHNKEIVEFFLSNGANVHARNIHGETPLHCATTGFDYNIKQLIDHGAHVNVVDNYGRTPLHHVVIWYPTSMICGTWLQ